MAYDGILLPLTTPFREARVAPDLLVRNIERYLEHGVAGFLVLGTTGEAPLLDEGERFAVWRAARTAVPDGLPLLAGVGLESTAATCRLAQLAGDEGASAVLVVTPGYFRGSMTEELLVRHFVAVAEASPVPVLLYNMPACTGVVIPVGAVATLAGHPNIVGLKDSSGDLGWLTQVLGVVPREFVVLSGSATTFLAALSVGAQGAILAMADVLPEPFVAVHRLQRGQRYPEAVEALRNLLPAVRAIGSRHGVAGIKAGMDLRGLHGGSPRPPLAAVGSRDVEAMRACLDELLSQGQLGGIRL